MTEQWTQSPRSLLLPSNPLYQNVLFLRLPEALEMVEKAAWYQLSTNDLSAIVQSEKWPMESRLRALTSALEIDPVDPVLRWFDLQLRQNGDPGTITQVTLGNAGQALRLGQFTGRRETIAAAVHVSDFKEADTLRGLAILGRSHLKTGEPGMAARLLLAAQIGELAFGTQPASSIQTTLQNLRALYQARLLTATEAREQARWRERLERFKSGPSAESQPGREQN